MLCMGVSRTDDERSVSSCKKVSYETLTLLSISIRSLTIYCGCHFTVFQMHVECRRTRLMSVYRYCYGKLINETKDDSNGSTKRLPHYLTSTSMSQRLPHYLTSSDAN